MELPLQQIAARMVAKGKGILAADESNSTAGKRLASINTESTSDSRRQYREIFLGTESVENYLSGVILYDETIRQNMSTGISFVEHLNNIGVIPGIKVDMGLQDLPNFPGESYTQGLDNLRVRLKEYYELGARFAKWRSLLTISNPVASDACIHTNAHGMTMYALLCQEAGIVPIVEPEILIEGEHTIEESYEVTKRALKGLFDMLQYFKVDLSGLILKSSMVISGKQNAARADAKTVGEMTYKCLLETVPAEVPGVVFLSGGQAPEEATENMYEVNKAAIAAGGAPWELTFSFARALQAPSLAIWNGHDENIDAARAKFTERLQANGAAREGEKVGNGAEIEIAV
ncbi:MAG: class I fructose-bisphosphate aldolase [Candidatus Peregrinibacteria bacterium]|nr:class I fructose-bisphosphate aldolase [Candidatus Peregrinibacteria bacterium]MDZ4245456.1 class I fructose-bisphosphate aldolase [Candidatus Gracilibacteria bacterium]